MSEEASTAARPSLVDGAEQALRNWLSPGRHRAGDRLPPEHDLASMLGVSRGTLRTALRRLEDAGQIVRRQGSGTFVGHIDRPGALQEGLERLESYASLARRRGVQLGARDVRIASLPVPEDLVAHLGVPAGKEVTQISRVVLADGRPIAIMVDTVPAGIPLPADEELGAGLERGEMVLDLLVAQGVPVAFANTRIGTRLIGPDDSAGASLEVTEPTAVLQLEELHRVTSGEPTHHSRDLFAPAGIDLRVVRFIDAPGPDQVGARASVAGRRAP